MEISSNIDAANIEFFGNEGVVKSEESSFFSSEKFQSVKSGISNVASAVFERLALAWSNLKAGATKLFTYGAEKFQASENKLMGSAHLSLALVAALPFGVASGVMGLFGMNIEPYLEGK